MERKLEEWGRLLAEPILSTIACEAFELWKHAPPDVARRFSVLVDADPLPGSNEEMAKATRQGATLLLGLPWELAHDGESYLFQGVRPAQVRRRLRNREAVAPLVTEAPVRVLVVSPRPEDAHAGYIDHRVSARPLVEALEALGEKASEVTLLGPPTKPALEAELLRARDAGFPYQVVHFDGHGTYDKKRGIGALCFEHPEDSDLLARRRTTMVRADELAAVMRAHRVPLVFLEACETARAEDDPTASVAGQLLAGGVASVVAMSHSVLVETAKRFVEAFYRELMAGRRIGDAMLAGQHTGTCQ
ncbi:MAG: CHAT domain-containing protein [Thermoanaerobaculia bacterium]|nr:CHAT domain-containing protein [Thermoanaerobaculia bacterium]